MRTKHLFAGVIRPANERLPDFYYHRRPPTYSDQEIIAAIKANDGCMNATARQLGKNHDTRIRRVAHRYGLFDPAKQRKKKPNPPGRQSTEVNLNLASLLRGLGYSATHVGRMLEVEAGVIRRRFKEAGRDWTKEAKALKGALNG